MTAHPIPAPLRALAGLLAAVAMPAAAVGLGELRLHSSLGEPLDATAALEAAPGETPRRDCFRQGRLPAGELPAIPGIAFAVEPDGTGWRVRLRTRVAVREPASRLRVDASCEGKAAGLAHLRYPARPPRARASRAAPGFRSAATPSPR